MAILTPKQLWQDFDRHLDLNAAVVRETTTPFIDKRIYFNGLKTSQGHIRIYARFLSCDDTKKPAVIFLPPAEYNINNIDAQKILTLFKNYSLLIIDYAGITAPDKAFNTIYPKDIDTYWQRDITTLAAPVTDMKTAAHYYFTSCALFALSYLETLNIDKDKIGVLGIAEGASLVYKISIDKAVKCGVSFFCGDIFSGQQEYIAYKAAFDSRAYAAKTNMPVLINAAANQADGAFDYLNDLYLGSTNSRFSTFALSSKAVSEEQRQSAVKWLDFMLIQNEELAADRIKTTQNQHENYAGKTKNLSNSETAILNPELNALPPPPKISSSVSEGATYVELSGEFERVEMFIAEDRLSQYRNWKPLRHSKISETKYLARVDSSHLTYNVYANITTKCGFNFSSEMISLTPLKVENIGTKRGRIIYKAATDTGGWLIKGGDFFETNAPVLKKGPFDLEGICAEELISFAAGDEANQGKSDSLLQIILHINKPGDIEFNIIIQNDGIQEFKHIKMIMDKAWAVVTLSPEDFKCSKGTPSFDKVIAIGIKSDEQLLINSIIWV